MIIIDEFRQKKIQGKRIKEGQLAKKLEAASFNPNSPKQVGEILYGKSYMNLPPTKTTKKSSTYSTDKDVLATLAIESDRLELQEFCKYIIEYKQAWHLNGTYVTGLIKHASSLSCIHSSFNLARSRTGRLSSSDPNVQNIPILEIYLSHVRAAF